MSLPASTRVVRARARAAGLLFLLSALSLGWGFAQLLGWGEPTDFRHIWTRQHYAARGTNPWKLRAETLARQPEFRRLLDPQLGPSPGTLHTPWSYASIAPFVPPLAWDAALGWFAVACALALALQALWMRAQVREQPPPRRGLVIGAGLALAAHADTLARGQLGILVTALLCAFLLAGARGRPWLAGLWLGMAWVKPQLSALFLLLPLVRGEGKTLLAALGYAAAATALASWWLGAGPLVLLAQVHAVGVAYEGPGPHMGLAYLLYLAGWEPLPLLPAMAAVGALATLLCWRHRRAPPLHLAALLAVCGHLWSYSRVYDQGTCLFLLVALGQLALRRGSRGDWRMFLAVGLSLWFPIRAGRWLFAEASWTWWPLVWPYAQLGLWLLGVAWLLRATPADGAPASPGGRGASPPAGA